MRRMAAPLLLEEKKWHTTTMAVHQGISPSSILHALFSLPLDLCHSPSCYGLSDCVGKIFVFLAHIQIG
jgi:hypothetical protein